MGLSDNLYQRTMKKVNEKGACQFWGKGCEKIGLSQGEGDSHETKPRGEKNPS